MAKIRTLKAEFFRNADVSKVGILPKLLAAGLVLAVADDEGRFKAAPNYLLGEIFTHDAIGVDQVESALRALASVDFVRLYVVAGRQYGALPTWTDHQRVPPSHFKKSKLPPPPNTKRVRRLPSVGRQMSVPLSRNGEDRNGRNGMERKEGSPEGINPPTERPWDSALEKAHAHVKVVA
jgi:hypothetical protein